MRRRLSVLLGALVVALAVVAIPAGRAMASSQQVSIMEDDPHIDVDPVGTLARMRLLGAQVVRVSVHWDWIAPASGSAHAPRGVKATDPAAYPAARWALWDEIATTAHQDGITVDFDVMGGAPRWAIGPGRPKGNRTTTGSHHPAHTRPSCARSARVIAAHTCRRARAH